MTQQFSPLQHPPPQPPRPYRSLYRLLATLTLLLHMGVCVYMLCGYLLENQALLSVHMLLCLAIPCHWRHNQGQCILTTWAHTLHTKITPPKHMHTQHATPLVRTFNTWLYRQCHTTPLTDAQLRFIVYAVPILCGTMSGVKIIRAWIS